MIKERMLELVLMELYHKQLVGNIKVEEELFEKRLTELRNEFLSQYALPKRQEIGLK